MLQRLQDYERLTAYTGESRLGRVEDFLFDDERWHIHYIVVNTGGLFGRAVLVSPFSVTESDWGQGRLLTRALGGSRFGARRDSMSAHTGESVVDDYTIRTHDSPVDPHLHTMASLRGIRVHAEDGDIGHVDDLIFDDGVWRARYLVVNPSGWTNRSPMLLPMQAIVSIDWLGCRAYLGVTRTFVAGAPAYDPERPVDHAVEDALARYYSVRDATARTDASVRPTAR